MTTLSTGTSSTSAYVLTPDTTGSLIIKTGSSNTTALTIDSSQNTAVSSLDVSGDLKFNSGFGTTANAYGCRAWLRFSGVTVPASIKAGGNISSLTDRGVGLYTVNLISAMPDDNYAVCHSVNQGNNIIDGGYEDSCGAYTFTTTSFMLNTANGSTGVVNSTDLTINCIAVFR